MLLYSIYYGKTPIVRAYKNNEIIWDITNRKDIGRVIWSIETNMLAYITVEAMKEIMAEQYVNADFEVALNLQQYMDADMSSSLYMLTSDGKISLSDEQGMFVERYANLNNDMIAHISPSQLVRPGEQISTADEAEVSISPAVVAECDTPMQQDDYIIANLSPSIQGDMRQETRIDVDVLGRIAKSHLEQAQVQTDINNMAAMQIAPSDTVSSQQEIALCDEAQVVISSSRVSVADEIVGIDVCAESAVLPSVHEMIDEDVSTELRALANIDKSVHKTVVGEIKEDSDVYASCDASINSAIDENAVMLLHTDLIVDEAPNTIVDNKLVEILNAYAHINASINGVTEDDETIVLSANVGINEVAGGAIDNIIKEEPSVSANISRSEHNNIDKEVALNIDANLNNSSHDNRVVEATTPLIIDVLYNSSDSNSSCVDEKLVLNTETVANIDESGVFYSTLPININIESTIDTNPDECISIQQGTTLMENVNYNASPSKTSNIDEDVEIELRAGLVANDTRNNTINNELVGITDAYAYAGTATNGVTEDDEMVMFSANTDISGAANGTIANIVKAESNVSVNINKSEHNNIDEKASLQINANLNNLSSNNGVVETAPSLIVDVLANSSTSTPSCVAENIALNPEVAVSVDESGVLYSELPININTEPIINADPDERVSIQQSTTFIDNVKCSASSSITSNIDEDTEIELHTTIDVKETENALVDEETLLSIINIINNATINDENVDVILPIIADVIATPSDSLSARIAETLGLSIDALYQSGESNLSRDEVKTIIDNVAEIFANLGNEAEVKDNITVAENVESSVSQINEIDAHDNAVLHDSVHIDVSQPCSSTIEEIISARNTVYASAKEANQTIAEESVESKSDAEANVTTSDEMHVDAQAALNEQTYLSHNPSVNTQVAVDTTIKSDAATDIVNSVLGETYSSYISCDNNVSMTADDVQALVADEGISTNNEVISSVSISTTVETTQDVRALDDSELSLDLEKSGKVNIETLILNDGALISSSQLGFSLNDIQEMASNAEINSSEIYLLQMNEDAKMDSNLILCTGEMLKLLLNCNTALSSDSEMYIALENQINISHYTQEYAESYLTPSTVDLLAVTMPIQAKNFHHITILVPKYSILASTLLNDNNACLTNSKGMDTYINKNINIETAANLFCTIFDDTQLSEIIEFGGIANITECLYQDLILNKDMLLSLQESIFSLCTAKHNSAHAEHVLQMLQHLIMIDYNKFDSDKLDNDCKVDTHTTLSFWGLPIRRNGTNLLITQAFYAEKTPRGIKIY